MSDREAMKLALEALMVSRPISADRHKVVGAIEALRDRLAAPEPEPVAWQYKDEPSFDGNCWHDNYQVTTSKQVAQFKDKNAQPLYAAPPAAAPRPEPSGYAYRYNDGVLRFNGGSTINGAPPIEVLPYWFAPPTAAPSEDIDALRQELAAVLSDWNSLVRASGSRTNGGAVGHVAALRREAERYRWGVENARWIRHEHEAYVAIPVAVDADLSCTPMRTAAIDAAMGDKT